MSSLSEDSASTKRSADDEVSSPSRKKQCVASNFNNQMKTFNHLPEEVKCAIFENLSFNDLMTSTLVCKNWNKVIGDNAKLTKKIKLKYRNKLFKNLAAAHDPLFERKYVNIKVWNLPPKAEYEHRFSQIHKVVKSIVIPFTKSDTFEDLQTFLEFFPNLQSLELVQWMESASQSALHNHKDTPIKLKYLQSLSVDVTSVEFAIFLLHAIEDVQLKDLVIINFGRGPADKMELLSKQTVKFLNGQKVLKTLELCCDFPLIIGTSIEELDPKFKLESLAIHQDALMSSDAINSDLNGFEVMRKLLYCGRNSCKTLRVLGLPEKGYKMFIDELVEFTRLKNLFFDLDLLDRPDSVYPSLSSLLAPRTMRCQLQNLIIFNRGLIDGRLKLTNNGCEMLLTLLLKQKDSLQKLMVEPMIPPSHRVWTVIGSQTNVKYFAGHLTRTVLKKMRGNSLVNLVNTDHYKPLEQDDDDGFWKKFRKRNLNFVSMKVNPYIFRTIETSHIMKLNPRPFNEFASC